jgi:hypothetical protein
MHIAVLLAVVVALVALSTVSCTPAPVAAPAPAATKLPTEPKAAPAKVGFVFTWFLKKIVGENLLDIVNEIGMDALKSATGNLWGLLSDGSEEYTEALKEVQKTLVEIQASLEDVKTNVDAVHFETTLINPAQWEVEITQRFRIFMDRQRVGELKELKSEMSSSTYKTSIWVAAGGIYTALTNPISGVSPFAALFKQEVDKGTAVMDIYGLEKVLATRFIVPLTQAATMLASAANYTKDTTFASYANEIMQKWIPNINNVLEYGVSPVMPKALTAFARAFLKPEAAEKPDLVSKMRWSSADGQPIRANCMQPTVADDSTCSIEHIGTQRDCICYSPGPWRMACAYNFITTTRPFEEFYMIGTLEDTFVMTDSGSHGAFALTLASSGCGLFNHHIYTMFDKYERSQDMANIMQAWHKGAWDDRKWTAQPSEYEIVVRWDKAAGNTEFFNLASRSDWALVFGDVHGESSGDLAFSKVVAKSTDRITSDSRFRFKFEPVA